MYRVHVLGPALRRNNQAMTEGRTPESVMIVRDANMPGRFILAEEVRFTSEVRLVHNPVNPLAHTGGRAVCYMVTKTPPLIRCAGNNRFFACIKDNEHQMITRPYAELAAEFGG